MGLRIKRGSIVKTVLPAIVVLVLLLVGWEMAARLGPWPDYLFPGPQKVAESILGLFTTGYLWPSLLVTVKRLFLGFAISTAIGGFMAFIMARWQPVRRGFKPYLLGFQSLPSIAWVPLAVLWFGYNEAALIFVTAIGSIFAVAIAFTDALSGVRASYLMAARNMGSHGVGIILRVMIPAALPPLISGAKQCWSFAWRSLLGAEIIFATLGLGFLLNAGRDQLDVAQVFAVMIVTLFVGLLFEVFVFSTIEGSIKRRYGN